jgi:guanosine-3',5'-bis(diphosphate) 3'-pyrophosphohydrolase
MKKKGEQLSAMLKLVTERFYGIFDKSGKPYVLHLLKVMHYLNSDDEELQCIALGHDFVEDIFPKDHAAGYALLRSMGFSERIITGIRYMTKIDGESEEDYLDKLQLSLDSVRVKLADLRHNSDIRRLKGLTDKDFARIQKYHRMYLVLSDHLYNFG